MDYEEELEEQYSAINKYQTKMQMENNDYYEPKIKTIRNDENGITLKATMPLITKEEMTTIDNNLQDIVNEFIQKVVKDKDLALSQYIVKKQNAEKQQLIKFLEDKIKECNDCILELSKNATINFYRIEQTKLIKVVFQEILNLVRRENMSDIEQLQQENKELNHRLEDEIECKEIAQGHEENIQINEAYERKEKEKYKNILAEFEKWLESQKKELDIVNPFDRCKLLTICEHLNKLQELKEGKK